MSTASGTGLREIVFATPEEAEDYLSNIAASIKDVDFEDDGFYMSYAGGSIGHCALHRGATSTLRYRVPQSGEYHFIILQSGTVTFSGDHRGEEAVARRKGLILGPNAHGRCGVAPDSAGISMITTEDAVRTYVERLVGDGRAIAVTPSAITTLDLAEPLGGTLARNVTGVFHELQALGRSGLSKLAMANFDEILLGLAAVSISPAVRNFVGDAPKASGSQSVRMAREYIHAHAADAISLSELAARLGVGLRALQLAFRRELGCSPREYLMTCRLELARSQLLSAGEGTTVTQIALECGFSDMTVFARKYREQFGEKPSETLRRR
ncbi:MAG: helix-turn-helix domain-containing protein [Hyphomicrobiaceae bacterium]